MLIKNSYSGCHRLYWQPSTPSHPSSADPRMEARLATFDFRGRQYSLEFDGLVDDIVVKSRRRRGEPVIGIEQLCRHLPRIFRHRDVLERGEKLEFAIIEGRPWSARRSTVKDGVTVYMMQAPGTSQSATLKADERGRFTQVVLRTRAQGITHEITARPDRRGRFVTFAEAVTVYDPKIY